MNELMATRVALSSYSFIALIVSPVIKNYNNSAQETPKNLEKVKNVMNKN